MLKRFKFPTTNLKIRHFSNKESKQGLGWKNDIYTLDNDPMNKFTEEEKQEIKARIMRDGRKLYWVGSGIVGGAFTMLGITYFVMGSAR